MSLSVQGVEESASKLQGTRQQIRGSSMLLLGKLPSKLINFAVQVMIVQHLTKDDYGAFAYCLAAVALVQSLVTFGLDRAITRFVPIYHEQRDLARLAGTLRLVVGSIAGLGFGAVITLVIWRLLAPVWGSEITGVHDLLPILILLAPLQAMDEVVIGMLACFGETKHILVRQHVLAPLLRLTVIVTLIVGGWGVYALAVGYVLAGLLGILIYARLLWRIMDGLGITNSLRSRDRVIPWQPVLAFTVPLLTTDLFYVAIHAMDAIMVQYYHGTTAVAVLRAVLPVAMLNQLVMTSFGVLYTPTAARLFARNSRDAVGDFYWQSALWVAVLTLPIFLLTFAGAGGLTELLFGVRYQDSAPILSVLALGFYVNAVLGFNGTTLKVFGQVRLMVAINLAATAVAFLSNLILIPPLGAWGAALATCGTLIFYNVLKQVALRVYLGINLFDAARIHIYGLIAGCAVGFWILQSTAILPFPAAFTLVLVSSGLLLLVVRNALDVAGTFPELLKLPGVKRLLATGRC